MLAVESEIRCKSNNDDYLPERVAIIYRSTASNLQTHRGVPIRAATMVPLSCWKTRYRVTGENRIARESSRCGGSAPLRRSRAIDATSIQTQYREQRDRRRIQPHCCCIYQRRQRHYATHIYRAWSNRITIAYKIVVPLIIVWKIVAPLIITLEIVTSLIVIASAIVARLSYCCKNCCFVADRFFEKIILGFYFVQKTNIPRYPVDSIRPNVD